MSLSKFNSSFLLYGIFFLVMALPGCGGGGSSATGSTSSGTDSSSDYEWRGFAGGGLFTTFAVDKDSPNVVYTSSDVSGMYKSIDYGDNWTPIDDANITSHATAHILIDPSNHNKIWSCSAHGLFRSDDQGDTWSRINSDIRCHIMVSNEAIAVSLDGQTILVASNRAVDETNNPFTNDYLSFSADGALYRSIDGGASFTDITSSLPGAPFPSGSRFPSVAFAPESNTSAFLLIDGQAIVKTANANSQSISFSDFSNAGTALDFSVMRLKRLAVGTSTIYFTAGSTTSTYTSYVYSSPVDSANWASLSAGMGVEDSSTQSAPVAMDPSIDNNIYLGHEEYPSVFSKSTDGGSTWTGLTVTKDSTYFFDETNTSHQKWNDPFQALISLKVDPADANRMYATTWWGVWRSDDGGSTWHEKVKGTQGTVTTDILFQNGILFSSNMDVFLHKSADFGATWNPSLPAAGETTLASGLDQGWDLELSSDSSTLYNAISTSTGPRVYKSADQGASWTEMSTGLTSTGDSEYDRLATIQLAAAPGDKDTLYATAPHNTAQGVFKWNIQTSGWDKLAGLPGAESISETNLYKSLETDPTSSARLFVGTYFQGLWYSNDGGSNWTLATGNGVDLSGQSVQKIVTLDDGTVWAAFADGIYKSTDNGATFSLSTPSSSRFGESTVEYFTEIVINPDDSSEIFAGTSKGYPVYENSGSIWHSTDGGASWTEITGNLNMKRINALAYYQQYLYIATEGANVLRKKIN